MLAYPAPKLGDVRAAVLLAGSGGSCCVDLRADLTAQWVTTSLLITRYCSGRGCFYTSGPCPPGLVSVSLGLAIEVFSSLIARHRVGAEPRAHVCALVGYPSARPPLRIRESLAFFHPIPFLRS